MDKEEQVIPERRASQPNAESSTMVKRKSEDDMFFDAKSRRSSNSSNSSSSSEEDIATIKELQIRIKNISDAELQRIFKRYDKNTTPEEKEDEIEKKSLIKKIAERAGTVLLLGGSFYGLNRAYEMNVEHGEEYLGQLGSTFVSSSIRYFQKLLRDKFGLLANAGAAVDRLARGETLQQAFANEAFIAAVHHYFNSYAQTNEAIRATLPIAGMAIGSATGSMVGFPIIGGTLGTVSGSSLGYLFSRAFFETIQEDIDVTDLTITAERLSFRLGQIVSSTGLIASSTAGYIAPNIVPNTEELKDFLTQLFNIYLEWEKRVLEK